MGTRGSGRRTGDMRLGEIGLGGAQHQLTFREDVKSRAQLRACVTTLVDDEHGHHFAVIDEGQTLMLSWMAVGCLREAGLIPKVD